MDDNWTRRELLAKTPLSAKWFSLILGAVLVAQLVYTPEGIIPKIQSDIAHLLHRRPGTALKDAAMVEAA